MRKIAIIVQRAGKQFTGGSEAYAMTLAEILSKTDEVDLLTTSAKDHLTWENELPAGEEIINPHLTLKRFNTDKSRGHYWNEIFGKIEHLAGLPQDSQEANPKGFYRQLPMGLSDAWIKAQGPMSSDLMAYLEDEQDTYDVFIFLTYLYATTYFGCQRIQDKKKVFIIPTFHDEHAAYLPSFRKYSECQFLFLTQEERRVAEETLYRRELRGTVLGFGMKDQNQAHSHREDNTLKDPFVLYAGRLEEGKGVGLLYEYFQKYLEKNRGVQLVTIGNGPLKDFQHPNITYKGFVTEKEKFELMKRAACLIQPSPFESLSIVLLEAFMMGTPGLVNGQCRVLKDHIEASGCGFSYTNYPSFERGLTELLGPQPKNHDLPERGRRYFVERYSIESFHKRIYETIFPNHRGP